MSSGYRIVARVIKSHGNKGEVVAVPADGLPLLLRVGLPVCVVPPRLKGDRWHTVTGVSTDARGQLVRLSGVCDQAGSEGLVGRYLLVSDADLPDDFALHDAASLVGREVVDERLGLLGSITEVMLGPANDVWVIDGDLGEVLVPVVSEYVDEVAPQGPLMTHLPADFVEGE